MRHDLVDLAILAFILTSMCGFRVKYSSLPSIVARLLYFTRSDGGGGCASCVGFILAKSRNFSLLYFSLLFCGDSEFPNSFAIFCVVVIAVSTCAPPE